jgi:hypothetical protein
MVANEPVDNTLLEAALSLALGVMLGGWLVGVLLGPLLPFLIRPFLGRRAHSERR